MAISLNCELPSAGQLVLWTSWKLEPKGSVARSKRYGEALTGRGQSESSPVRRTPKRGLRQVDFEFEGSEIRGLEQNPQTKSRWAQMARSGKKVMQFLSEGRYVANVADGKVTFYRE